jgi:hypothetical protein
MQISFMNNSNEFGKITGKFSTVTLLKVLMEGGRVDSLQPATHNPQTVDFHHHLISQAKQG